MTFNRLNSANYKLSEDNVACICREYQQGTSVFVLADNYRVAVNTIYYWLKKKGITITKSKKRRSTRTLAARAAISQIASLSPSEIQQVKSALQHL